MRRVVYIGDEAHAAAWRLTGIDVRVAGRDDDTGSLLEHSQDAALVLLSEACAAQLPASTLERSRRASTPLLLTLPGRTTLQSPPDLATRVRRLLGMES